jgi:hypothetical protein
MDLLLLMKSEESAKTSGGWWISLNGIGEYNIFSKICLLCLLAYKSLAI